MDVLACVRGWASVVRRQLEMALLLRHAAASWQLHTRGKAWRKLAAVARAAGVLRSAISAWRRAEMQGGFAQWREHAEAAARAVEARLLQHCELC